MPIYKVYGSRTAEFYITVEAADPDEAYDLAAEDSGWLPVEMDDPIEPHTVQLLDSPETGELQLNKDNEWPSMESGILIEGTN